MDERGWFTATKPQSLFLAASGKTSERKVSLCLCGCIRQFWDALPESSFQLAVEFCERVADHELPHTELGKVHELFRSLPYQEIQSWRAYNAVYRLVDPNRYPWRVMHEVLQVVRDPPGRQRLCCVIRDVFGTPFRPLVTFSPDWRTDTAVSLARTMYESREFGAMPILADALQDAGCDNTDILDHCRDAKQVHVRGCWVVDLVLGKS